MHGMEVRYVSGWEPDEDVRLFISLLESGKLDEDVRLFIMR